MEEIKETKKVKKTMTEKQKAARMLNLANGRKKRMEMIKQKQESKSHCEYDIESDNDSDSSSSGDESDFVISKKKKTIKPKKVAFSEPKTKVSKQHNETDNYLKKDIDELKNMMYLLATEQKKTKKAAKKQTKRSSGGTKLVILPQTNAPNNPQPNKSNDSQMDALRRSLGL